jgi:lipopolysaccharide biosynthesis regulator YciM
VFFSRHDGASFPLGEHVVEWETGIATASGLRVAPQPSRLQFEVRDSSSETAAEEARRHAIRAFRNGDDAVAAQWVTRLLELNPQSHAAHVLRGDLSLRAGDKAAAAACFDAALRILETHADQEYNRWTPAALTRATIDGLKARLNVSR